MLLLSDSRIPAITVNVARLRKKLENAGMEGRIKTKKGILKNKNPRLHTDEILLSLAISANNNENAKKAVELCNKIKAEE